MDAHAGSRTDFISIHHYGGCDEADPSALWTHVHEVRSLLDEDGVDAPLLLTEWNIGTSGACGLDLYKAPQTGAYVSAALSLLQADTGLNVERAYFFSGAPQMSLFGWDEATHEFTLEPSAFAFRWHASLFGGTQRATEICPTGGVCASSVDSSLSGQPVYVVAADTAPGAVSVVLANYGEAAVSVDVAGSGHTRYALERAPLALSGDPKVDGRYSVDDGAYVPDGDADLLFEGFITTTTGDVSATGVRIDLDAWETVMLELTSG